MQQLCLNLPLVTAAAGSEAVNCGRPRRRPRKTLRGRCVGRLASKLFGEVLKPVPRGRSHKLRAFDSGLEEVNAAEDRLQAAGDLVRHFGPRRSSTTELMTPPAILTESGTMIAEKQGITSGFDGITP